VRRLRELLERRFDSQWADWIAVAKRFRQQVQSRGLPAAKADVLFDRFFAATVDEQALVVRLPTAEEELELLSPGDQRGTGERSLGRVSLVGAGPGNPGLLTVRGLACLHSADAVVYDRLAIPVIPLDLPDSVELHAVGKEPGHHPVPQEEINALLLRLARAGKHVVRLKGGDPFVFARGGEEVLVLRAAGIPCEVVPGVTAGIAAPGAAGIPVTFRGEAVRLTFITAHESGAAQMRWDLLAQDTRATLVGYMGVSNLAEVGRSLIAAGMNAMTPAAVIEQGTLPRQRSVRAPLAEIAEVAQKSQLRPPAIFVIGPVVAHAAEIEDPAQRSLQGARIAQFAPRSALTDALTDAGAEVLVTPGPLTSAARLVIGAAPLSGWIVRTVEEVEALDQERMANGLLARGTLWCLGAELAAFARQKKWLKVAELAIDESMSQIVVKIRQALGASGAP
jgi:uroporphyrin-III C-methyltransferase